MDIHTIGYEGSHIDDFISTLEEVGVKHVIDVRDIAGSRKRDFSKNILRANLASHGIEYSHLRALGDPKEGRDAMRRGDEATFKKIFQERLDSAPAQAALLQAIELADQQISVLLCYERDPKTCHRTIVAKAMARKTPFTIQHLGVHSGSKIATRRTPKHEYRPTC